MSQRIIDLTGAPVYDPWTNVTGSASGEAVDVITTSTTAASSRNAEELAARIRAAGGKLTVGANASEIIVALNNTLRFSVTRNAAGTYEITDRLTSSNLMLLAIPAVLLLVVLMSKR